MIEAFKLKAVWVKRAGAMVLPLLLLGSPAVGQVNAEVAKAFGEFQISAPNRAFVIGPDGRANWRAGASDLAKAISDALGQCEERVKQACTLHAVNNFTVLHQDWRAVVPERALNAPDIGRLRPQPYWAIQGPKLAWGLLIWSHGYKQGADSTNSAPQVYLGRFTRLGYDIYRFDRELITDWTTDAAALAQAIKQAREMGYRRVILAGQSAGAWVSLVAAVLGAPVDGVIATAPAHHGQVSKTTEFSRARWDWQQIVNNIKPGPRIVLVNFADDDTDVGGRMTDARTAFSACGVDALIIDEPEGFKGHFGASSYDFNRKFGGCIKNFVEEGKRQPPCE